MSEFSACHEIYVAARAKWLDAERVSTTARWEMEAAERNRKTAWDKLVEAAAVVLTPEEIAIEAKRQFGGVS